MMFEGIKKASSLCFKVVVLKQQMVVLVDLWCVDQLCRKSSLGGINDILKYCLLLQNRTEVGLTDVAIHLNWFLSCNTPICKYTSEHRH